MGEAGGAAGGLARLGHGCSDARSLVRGRGTAWDCVCARADCPIYAPAVSSLRRDWRMEPKVAVVETASPRCESAVWWPSGVGMLPLPLPLPPPFPTYDRDQSPRAQKPEARRSLPQPRPKGQLAPMPRREDCFADFENVRVEGMRVRAAIVGTRDRRPRWAVRLCARTLGSYVCARCASATWACVDVRSAKVYARRLDDSAHCARAVACTPYDVDIGAMENNAHACVCI